MTVVEAAAIGSTTVGARLYRWRGERLLGVVVKVVCELRHGAVMTPMAPTAWRTRASVAHPADEPFPLQRAEIVVGPLPQVARTPGAAVGLGVARAGAMVLDVRRTAGDEGARDATAGLGPLLPSSPARAALGGGLDPAELVGARELELPDELDPSFFQAAPVAQRTDHLQPGDVLVLAGMSPIARVLHAAIPPVRGAAVVQVGGDPPRRFGLRLDRIHVAPDAMIAELSFRGRLPVPDRAQAIRIVGGLDGAAAPFQPPPPSSMAMTPVTVLADAPPVAAREERPPPTEIFAAPPTAPLGPSKGGTMILDAAEAAAVRAPRPSSPLEAASFRAPLPSSPFESTAVVSPDAPAPSSLPFHRMPGSSPGSNRTGAPSAPIPGAPWAGEVAPAAPVDEPGPSTVVFSDAGPGAHGAPPDAAGAPADAGPPADAVEVDAVEVDLALDLDLPPSIRGSDLPPAPVPRTPSPEPPPPEPVQATLEDVGHQGGAPPAGTVGSRAKADPWRRDADAEGPGAPLPAPPPAPKAGPTRPDVSAGLYKRFKR